MPLQLREVRDGDADFLARLYVSTREDLTCLPLDADQLAGLIDLQRRAQEADHDRRFPDAESRILLVDGSAVGRVRVHRAAEGMRLVDLALLPDRRGCGWGTAVLRDLQAEAAGRGAELRLSVRRENAGARRLYARLGFVELNDDPMYVEMVWRPGQTGARENATS
ncbi:GNAT family N-acetyltransferase [Nocardioides sp.]|uniref:GNAT family N-acetyltransferase n=1 Tax=Nocardioides sp. TaxID=35761 RepID=UPI003569FAAD